MSINHRLYGPVTHEDEQGDEWTVGAREYRAPTPGSRRGHPGTWDEGDDGDIGELVAVSVDSGDELEEPAMCARWGEDVVDELRVSVWRAALRQPAECDGPAPACEPDYW